MNRLAPCILALLALHLRHKKITGGLYHTQDDIMYCNLTVEENLLFSARYRLPVSYTHSQHVYYVERAIQVFCDLDMLAAHAVPHLPHIKLGHARLCALMLQWW